MNKQQKIAQKKRKLRDTQLQKEIEKLQGELLTCQEQEKYHNSRTLSYKLSDGVSIVGSTRANHLLARMYQRHHAVRYGLAVRTLGRRIRSLELRKSTSKPLKAKTPTVMTWEVSSAAGNSMKMEITDAVKVVPVDSVDWSDAELFISK